MRALRRIHSQQQATSPPRWKRDVRLLALSRTISMAGAEAGYIALIALAWDLTGSASQASMVLLASVAARTLGSPLAGWIGDHFDRKRVVILGELGVAASLIATALSQTMWQVMLACMVTTFSAATLGAALDASLPTLVPKAELAGANSTIGMARTAGHMLGPMLGGLLVAGFGARSAFLLDAGSSIIAAAVVLGIGGAMGGRAAAAATTAGSRRSDDGGILAGVHQIARDPLLRLLAASWAPMCVCFAFVTAAELPLSVEFGMDEPGLGMIVTAWSAGSLLGAWLARKVRIETRGAAVLAASAVVAGIVFAATGIAGSFWQVLAFMAVGGFAISLGDVVEMTLIQDRAEDHIRARVLAAYQGVMSAIWGTNLAFAGMFVDLFSARTAYMFAGLWCLVGAVGFTYLARMQGRERHAQLLRMIRPRHALESELAAGA